jgi:hypothetical protein
MAIFSELWSFMKVRKKWWLGPIVVTMLLLSVLIVLTEGSAVAPFIYALFFGCGAVHLRAFLR